jgi:ABA4-like protein
MSGLFDLAFFVATPFWALMILAPAWRWTAKIMATPWIVLPVIVVWGVAAAPVLGPLWALVVSPSLDGFTALLAEPAAVTAVWAQIIAWDLFVGRWMYLDSRARHVHPLVMGPILVLTVLLSPIGLPLYLAVRKRS